MLPNVLRPSGMIHFSYLQEDCRNELNSALGYLKSWLLKWNTSDEYHFAISKLALCSTQSTSKSIRDALSLLVPNALGGLILARSGPSVFVIKFRLARSSLCTLIDGKKDGAMSARIIHFGDDRFNRLECLRDAGYHVDVHNRIDSFRIAMQSGQHVDAVSLEEMGSAQLQEAIASAREGEHVPLILFQASTKRRKRPEFSLVIPLIDESAVWMGRLAELIEHRREACEDELTTFQGQQRRTHVALSTQSACPADGSAKRNDQRRAEFPASDSEQMSLKSAKSSQFLRSLTPDMLRELEAVTSFTFCAPGTVLFIESQIPHEVFFLLEGQVRLFMNAHDGRRLTVHIANAGEILGLAAVFTAAAHKTSAETVYPARVGSVRCEDLMKFLMIHSKAAQAAARELSETCDRTYTRLRTIGVTPSNRAKLSRLILEWAAQGKQTERGLQIHVALKHGEIAECIGTCRESVTRILRDLQRWQVIELRGSLLTIADLPALEQCADLR